MRRWQTSKNNRPRRGRHLLVALFLIPLACGAAFSLSPDWSQLVERTALTAAMVNMPEGGIALLKQHFAGEVLQPDTPTDPAQSEASASEEQASSSQSTTQSEADEPLVSARPSLPISPPRDAPEIPEAFRGTLLQENMAGDSATLIQRGMGLIRNYTNLSDQEVTQLAAGASPIKLEETDAPQVLIFHTHATESYELYDSETFDTRATWRDTNNSNNMAVVGDVLAKTLEDAGIGVVHDVTQHDYPSYTGAYERSAETIKKYLKQYPTIKVVLDVHRDAVLRETDVTVKPVVEIDGKKAAQLMIITGSDDGTMNIPNWRENLKFAASLQDQIEQDFPQLTRPIFFCYRKYNMDLSTGSLLLEVGSNANTLEESSYTAELVGQSLVKLLQKTK